jgi:hypothetical protein
MLRSLMEKPDDEWASKIEWRVVVTWNLTLRQIVIREQSGFGHSWMPICRACISERAKRLDVPATQQPPSCNFIRYRMTRQLPDAPTRGPSECARDRARFSPAQLLTVSRGAPFMSFSAEAGERITSGDFAEARSLR